MSSPEWRMNTVRWIEENCPHILIGTADERAPKKLEKAIAAVNYLEAEAERAGTKHSIKKMRSHAIETWSEKSHKDFVSYIEDGTYTARMLKLREEEDGVLGMIDESGKKVSEELRVAEGEAPKSKKLRNKLPESVELEDAITYGSNIAGSW